MCPRKRTRSLILPAIPAERQVPVLEMPVMGYIRSMFVSGEVHEKLHRRLEAGAAKYGTAWNEVDLTLDLQEEILDAMNYVAMLAVRLEQVKEAVTHEEFLRISKELWSVATYLERVYSIVSHEIPHAEGPSSKDWLPQHGQDPAEAQARFQEVVNSAN